MLTHINIRNLAIVDQLDIAFKQGMTVVTGETGAGKSIALDALDLALGGRADSAMIRSGADRAEITASFSVTGCKAAKDWMTDNALDDGDECILRRVIHMDGPSKGFINGRAVTMQSLKTIGELLVDIQGQHAHQYLLKRDAQRDTLDDFAQHTKLVAATHEHYQHLRQLQKQHAALQQSQQERADRLELLQYQINELEELAIEEHEFKSLEEQHERLAHINQLQEGAQQALYTLVDNDENALINQLNSIVRRLEQLNAFDPALNPITQQFQNGCVQLEDAAHELRHYTDNLEGDPQQLQHVEERLGLFIQLSRKHHVEPDTLLTTLTQMQQEVIGLQNLNTESSALDDQIKHADSTYTQHAQQLTQSRQHAAEKLAQQVTKNMQKLGMKNGTFKIDIQSSEKYSAHGHDVIEYQVSANPGQPIQAMAKVASGGELSRISLAIHVITAATSAIPTLIFDEVDVGIGGGTAEIVGRLLKQLSNKRQVICITHQPQVAALGDQHLHVNKFISKNTTKATVTELNDQQRTDELARMLGGVEITDQTRSHAKEMIERAQTID